MLDICPDECPSTFGGSCACEKEDKLDQICKDCGSTEDLYFCNGDDLAPLGWGATAMVCGNCYFDPQGLKGSNQ